MSSPASNPEFADLTRRVTEAARALIRGDVEGTSPASPTRTTTR
jgi:hypothetical protein